METRVDKYKNNEYKQSRVEKNQDLYKMIYSAYDKFENYKVPMEEKEIDLNNIKRNVSNRSEYKQYGEFNKKNVSSNKIDLDTFDEKEKEIYDIKEILSKVKSDNDDDRKTEVKEEKYLDKLHLKDDIKTNLDKLKEEYDDIVLDNDDEEKLYNTANLSLSILSDLKSNDDTMISPPMKSEDDTEDDIPFKKKELVKSDEDMEEDSFYSDMYKFKKKDFEVDEDDDFIEEGDNKFLFKILIIISFVILMAIIVIYLIGYFSK